jgi:hypothetical protein
MEKINGSVKSVGRVGYTLKATGYESMSIYNYHFDNYFTLGRYAITIEDKATPRNYWISAASEQEVIDSIEKLITKHKLKIHETKITKRSVNASIKKRTTSKLG